MADRCRLAPVSLAQMLQLPCTDLNGLSGNEPATSTVCAYAGELLDSDKPDAGGYESEVIQLQSQADGQWEGAFPANE